ncbi:hypothetical protein [Candidatus Palauibacter sp.]|uniref:hypothetical protein n=1 Tax=Candidatus Palauibacter sp. TaxID=3101350 RepID=UPI003AF22B3D
MTAVDPPCQAYVPVTFTGVARWVASERARIEREQRARLIRALPWLTLRPPEFCACDSCDLFPNGFMRWGD